MASAPAVQRASPSLGPAAAQQAAKDLERKAFSEATSRQEYDDLCKSAASADEASNYVVPRQVHESPETEDVVHRRSSSAGLTFGAYTHATHHRDGLYSTVYEAVDPQGAVVAVKLTYTMMDPPHDARRESRILKEVRSDHVIPLLDTFTLPNGRFALVFPFVTYDMEQLLQEGLVSAPQVRSHMHDLLTALEYVHSKDVIHRDVKPSNLLVRSPDGPAYLADFGIVWSSEDPASEARDQKITDVGTTCYRPPELLFGHAAYDESLDLWAAGCVLAEAVNLSHEPLFDSGPVGSELALLSSIFQTLGTPSLETWPEAAKFPDWGKMDFYKYPAKPWISLLPNASNSARDLVSKLVCYESSNRLTASQV
ncbi:MAG: hypothetical protein M1817_001984 [Caeruleum heppii]|nr:MAG: hypothetical protein M1817_001984 [Caeruleum heppii]